ncbi:ATP-binding protein [Kitasatospora sp. NPDC051170]|uniref:ATP-binding protein n=1 Tax=Kitasatospora sp. NPDC051170 TaxID=3364056 RepID=UPI0037996727
MNRHLIFTGDREAALVSEGLAFTRQFLADWHFLPASTVDDAQLVVAELLTNAIRRTTAGPVALDLARDGSRLRIAVTDPCPGITLPDRLTSHRPGQIGGHGLFIVERIAVAWGTFRAGSRKTVWADLLLRPKQPDRVPQDRRRASQKPL